MAETIDGIQEKLRPRSIVASATKRVKTATTEGSRPWLTPQKTPPTRWAIALVTLQEAS
jgi:hypothetical protein